MHPLKKARVLRGLTQWDIAINTGIPACKVSLVERGYIPLQKLKPSERRSYLKLLGEDTHEEERTQATSP